MQRGGDGYDEAWLCGCALPVVLEHNTPNNSIPLLWAETAGADGAHAMEPLFFRRDRHASEQMSNPFLRRATEYIRDDSAFLSIVSPEPLTAFVAKHKNRPLLFQQTVRVIGTPGSGKTMMASLVEFRLVENVPQGPEQ